MKGNEGLEPEMIPAEQSFFFFWVVKNVDLFVVWCEAKVDLWGILFGAVVEAELIGFFAKIGVGESRS